MHSKKIKQHFKRSTKSLNFLRVKNNCNSEYHIYVLKLLLKAIAKKHKKLNYTHTTLAEYKKDKDLSLFFEFENKRYHAEIVFKIDDKTKCYVDFFIVRE